MRLRNRVLWLLALVGLLVCFAVTGSADPPARIGRLNFLSGSVSFRPGDLDDWTPAVINVPLKTGDHLWTDVNSSVEIHVGSTALRLAQETAFAFLNLDDQVTQIRLTQGTLNVRLRQLGDGEVFEIDTPNAAINLLRPGLYRIDVDVAGTTTLTDRLGESEVTAAGSAFTVHPQERAVIAGTDLPAYDIATAPPEDGWETWCAGRDRREEEAVSVRYVSREMVGYEDLDEFGTWRTVPEYGAVWVPAAVPVGWAPYRFGHWMWIEPWGWTWVDDMAWGFAPFHYGRWTHVQGTWMWVPGRVVARPVYAPALVAFVGGNSWHASLSIGSGVAWFPLGPREAYVPAYHVSDTYVRNINVTHVNVTNVNITNINVVNKTYINRNVPGAVTAVSRDAFVRAQPVSRAGIPVPQHAVAAAPVSGMTAAIAPRPESLTGRPGMSFTASHPPARAFDREVVARTTPPPPQVPFAARQSALIANPGQPLDGAKLAALRQKAPTTQPLVKSVVPPAARPYRPQNPVNNPAPVNVQAPTPVPVPAPAPAPALKAPPKPAVTGENTTDRSFGKPVRGENDRPGRGAVTTQPATPQPLPRVEPQQPKRVAPPAAPSTPGPSAPLAVAQPKHPEPPHPDHKVETERGARPERPKDGDEKPHAKPAESEKGKPKEEKSQPRMQLPK
jgi:hypothetical protein